MASALAWRPRTVAKYWLAVARGAASASPPKGSNLPAAIDRLKKRSEFLAVAAANRRWTMPGLVLQAKPTRTPQDKIDSPDAEEASGAPHLRVGFTATKKIGNAVIRNRAKRRLRAAARETLPLSARAGHDYVLVARAGILTRDFQALLGDIQAAMAAAHAKLDARQGGGR